MHCRGIALCRVELALLLSHPLSFLLDGGLHAIVFSHLSCPPRPPPSPRPHFSRLPDLAFTSPPSLPLSPSLPAPLQAWFRSLSNSVSLWHPSIAPADGKSSSGSSSGGASGGGSKEVTGSFTMRVILPSGTRKPVRITCRVPVASLHSGSERERERHQFTSAGSGLQSSPSLSPSLIKAAICDLSYEEVGNQACGVARLLKLFPSVPDPSCPPPRLPYMRMHRSEYRSGISTSISGSVHAPACPS